MLAVSSCQASRPFAAFVSAVGEKGFLDGAIIGSEGRNQSENQARQDRSSHCKQQNTPVDLHLVGSWQTVGPEPDKRTRADRSQQ
jgi:hypothetical protein